MSLAPDPDLAQVATLRTKILTEIDDSSALDDATGAKKRTLATSRDPPALDVLIQGPFRLLADRKLMIAEYYRACADFEAGEACRLLSLDRRSAIRAAAAAYVGTPSRRAKALACDLAGYAGNGWPRDRDRGAPPSGASAQRRGWFRILAGRDGEPIGWRRIFDVLQSDAC